MAKCCPPCGLVGDGCETDLLTSLHGLSCMHDVETLCIVAKALMVATESGCRLPVLFACALSVPLGDCMLIIRLTLLAMKPISLVIRTSPFYVEIEAANFYLNWILHWADMFFELFVRMFCLFSRICCVKRLHLQPDLRQLAPWGLPGSILERFGEPVGVLG